MIFYRKRKNPIAPFEILLASLSSARVPVDVRQLINFGLIESRPLGGDHWFIADLPLDAVCVLSTALDRATFFSRYIPMNITKATPSANATNPPTPTSSAQRFALPFRLLPFLLALPTSLYFLTCAEMTFRVLVAQSTLSLLFGFCHCDWISCKCCSCDPSHRDMLDLPTQQGISACGNKTGG